VLVFGDSRTCILAECRWDNFSGMSVHLLMMSEQGQRRAESLSFNRRWSRNEMDDELGRRPG
jgi:hypothetical protein